MQAFREAGFGVAVRNRWDTAAHHAKVRQECAERAAQMRRALREEHFKRAAAAKRGPSGRPATLTEKLLEKEYRPELSTRMHRCDSCFEDVHAMASDFSVCTTVYVEENTSATSATSAQHKALAAAAAAAAAAAPTATSPLDASVKASSSASTSFTAPSCLCSPCHDLKCTFASELAELAQLCSSEDPEVLLGFTIGSGLPSDGVTARTDFELFVVGQPDGRRAAARELDAAQLLTT